MLLKETMKNYGVCFIKASADPIITFFGCARRVLLFISDGVENA